MALQSSGQISLGNIYDEFHLNSDSKNNVAISGYLRGGSRVPNATSNNAIPTNAATGIKFSNYYGSTKAFVYSFYISTDTSNFNLRDQLISKGWSTNEPVIVDITVVTNIILGSSSKDVSSLIIASNFPTSSNITLVNNGIITGRGGPGGHGGYSGFNNTDGESGGTAMSISYPINVYNNGTISGGGGGGGGGGNGAGGDGLIDNDRGTGDFNGTGGRGGRASRWGNIGGPGGSRGTAGSHGTPSDYGGGGGGGAAGYYLVGSSNVSWQATGTRLGSVS